jgi:hypothetical protein
MQHIVFWAPFVLRGEVLITEDIPCPIWDWKGTHTSGEREQVTNVITQQGREENSVEFGLLAWPKENSATWTLLKRTNFPTR